MEYDCCHTQTIYLSKNFNSHSSVTNVNDTIVPGDFYPRTHVFPP